MSSALKPCARQVVPPRNFADPDSALAPTVLDPILDTIAKWGKTFEEARARTSRRPAPSWLDPDGTPLPQARPSHDYALVCNGAHPGPFCCCMDLPAAPHPWCATSKLICSHPVPSHKPLSICGGHLTTDALTFVRDFSFSGSHHQVQSAPRVQRQHSAAASAPLLATAPRLHLPWQQACTTIVCARCSLLAAGPYNDCPNVFLKDAATCLTQYDFPASQHADLDYVSLWQVQHPAAPVLTLGSCSV